MSDLNADIIYTYKIMSNADQRANEIAEAVGEADDRVNELDRNEITLKVDTEATTEAIKVQQVNLAQQVTLMMGLKSAVNSVSSSLIQMGLVEGEAAENLQAMNQGFNLLCGFATGLKALAGIQEALALASLKEAIVSTYTSVLESPWKLALASAGLGAAAGVAMAYGTTNNSTTTNIIQIQDATGGQATTASRLNSTITGGRIS